MEESTIIKEVLHALSLHSKHIDKRFDQVDKRFEQVDKRFEEMENRFEERFNEMDRRFEERFNEMDRRFDRLGKKVDGIRVDLYETQETTDYLSSKIVQHEKKMRNVT